MLSRHQTALLAAFVAVGLSGCPDEGTQQTASLSIQANRFTIPHDGTSAQITALAREATGAAGTGNVEFTTNKGLFSTGGRTATVALTDGSAQLTFSCDVSLDSACTGQAQITATWNGRSMAMAITLSAAQPGTPDAGGNNPPDAGGNNPPDAGPGPVPEQSIAWDVKRNRIYLDIGDQTQVAAQVLRPDGGGFPQGIALTLATDLGTFRALDGGALGQSFVGTTDSNSEVRFFFRDLGEIGYATITAAADGGVQGATSVEIARLNRLLYQGTTCNGTPCSELGNRLSGYQEQADIRFVLLDDQQRPVAGVPVSFTVQPGVPSGLTVIPDAVTDANGIVVARATSGYGTGGFAILATVVPGSVEAISATINVVRPLPSNRAFSLSCSPQNIVMDPTVSTSVDAPVKCTARLADRNGVLAAAQPLVMFATEAGTLTAGSVPSVQGLSMVGLLPNTTPRNVAPLTALPTQKPTPRLAEPTNGDRNPRDGVVSILAYVRGEEYFDDTNGDGEWQAGERLYDQSEPFVDYDDDGTRTGDEPFYDADQDGTWDPANGIWDANTFIWTDTRIVFSGAPDPARASVFPPVFSGPCGTGELQAGEFAALTPYFPDANLNRISSRAWDVNVDDDFAWSEIVWSQDLEETPDVLGVGTARVLVDRTTGEPCGNTSTFCHYQPQFYDWSAGHLDLIAYLWVADSTNYCRAVSLTFRVEPKDDSGTMVGTSATTQGSVGTSPVIVSNEPPAEIRFNSSSCSGEEACVLLGARGSGYNETAKIRFTVLDADEHAVEGATINFTLSNTPAGTTVTASAVSNDLGEVVATVTSGAAAGQFEVVATVAGDATVSSRSGNLAVIGALPVNRGFDVRCERVNIPAFAGPVQPYEFTTQCKAHLVDRYGNPIGRVTPVSFKSEAGTISTGAYTTAFDLARPSELAGQATASFTTLGVFPPADVTAVGGEPAGSVGNPRDGLVSVIAYAEGEEAFDDGNMNGQWDSGERFFDQGEPLVDSNDDGDWDEGELYFDRDNDRQWDGPNGIWDARTLVWSEARIVYTGAPDTGTLLPAAFAQDCATGPLLPGSSALLGAYFPDENGNALSIEWELQASITGTTASVGVQGGRTDTYGFTVSRRLYEMVGTTMTTLSCVPGSVSCGWKYAFSGFSGGYAGTVKVSTNASATTCVNAVVSVSPSAGSFWSYLTATSSGGAGPLTP